MVLVLECEEMAALMIHHSSVEEKKYRMRAHTPQRERERKILLNILELTGYSQPRQSSVRMQNN